MSTTNDKTNINQKEFKIVLAGNPGVGKTSIFYRYINDTFNPAYLNTVGVDFKTKTLNINSETVVLKIWDTAGQEKFRSITKEYFHWVNGVILTFDVSDRESFVALQEWIKLIGDSTDFKPTIVLAGNKCDLERSVSQEEAEKFAYDNDKIKYFDTSAQSGQNITSLFEYLAQNCIQIPVPIPIPDNESTSCKC